MKQKSSILNKLFLLCLVLSCSICSFSCAYQTYSKTIEKPISLTFQYSKKDYLYPHSRFLYSSNSYIPPKLNDTLSSPALISVDTFRNSDSLDLSTHINIFTNYMKKQKGIIYFGVRENGTLNLGGIKADYSKYGYDSYDTVPVSYTGIFVSLVYKGFIIDIDLLTSAGSVSAEEAFQRLIKTFRVSDTK
jgi:hypothetical protein